MKAAMLHSSVRVARSGLHFEGAACGGRRISAAVSQRRDVKQTMNWIIEPNADVLWDSVGTIITEAGTRGTHTADG